MSRSVEQLANDFAAAATRARDPVTRSKILRKGAQTFAGLAQMPENAKFSQQLQNVAFDFVSADARNRPPTTDDFKDLLRETAVAYAEVGDDPMDLIARRREIHDERTPGPPRVSIAPGTFNADATLGRSAQIKYNPTNDERVRGITDSETVAFWQGLKPETQAMTVDVALTNLPPPVAPTHAVAVANVRTFGRVEYGSDGNKTAVEFDVAMGTRLTVPGNYVSVIVGADKPFDSFPTETVVLGASIAPFAAPSQAPVVRTRYVDLLNGGDDSDFIPIPLKAVMLLPIQTNMALGETAILSFYSFGGGFAPLFTVPYLKVANNVAQPIPIIGDVSFVVVSNPLAPGQHRNFRLPFQLSL